MTINDKIKQILIDKNLTPSYFADEIGVQRSSISHILSGRNRPSFDIIQKIIRRFPELGYDWIMEEDNIQSNQIPSSGYGNRPNNNRPATDRRDPYAATSQLPFSYVNQPSGVRTQRNEIPPATTPVSPPVQYIEPASESTNTSEPVINSNAQEKKVERILIFYTDGSFREYMPTT
ncbi:helix-turn-helix transcriptional regulator [Spirosoma sp. BT702]|uniref:Helix-turn-helix transcriptional regulator n=1 Tax=Spirosoma profusum TaxID=2771354 RepID=A0A927ANC6_9BACT|nr:helix-turn-helix transcriptional regulator [Spirosoma profusum]MBD2701579.1 helix-turn-helix transcriptional regulator [Spirosoma profusum]